MPKQSAEEASLVNDAVIYPANSLLDVCAHLTGHTPIMPHNTETAEQVLDYPDFNEVKGQNHAKRALTITAAGGHSILMSGPRGTGKSMLAARFAGILPSMTEQEALESAAIQSLNGSYKLSDWKRRNFRAPHHTASGVALVGGGSVTRPG